MRTACSRVGPHFVCAVIVVLGVTAIVFGFHGRLDGFGSRQLAVDEYYFVTSVLSIIRNWIPELPGGGYYVRGILIQYVTAVCVLIFGESGFAYRFPSLCFSIGTVIVMYWYSQRRLGIVLAIVLCACLMLSSWEVEFARFARMYSAFQFVTVVYFLTLDKCSKRLLGSNLFLPHIVAVIAVLTHELGILLLPFLLVPLVGTLRRRDWDSLGSLGTYSIVSVGIVIACAAWQFSDLRNAGVVQPFPTDFVPQGAHLLRLPAFPFWNVGSGPGTSLYFFLVVLLLVASLVAAARLYSARIRVPHIFAALMVTSAFAHNLVLTAILAAVLIFRFGAFTQKGEESVTLLTWVAVAISLCWLLFALAIPGWRVADGHNVGSLIGAIRVTFFGWPDLWTPLLKPWLSESPLIAVLAIGAVAYQLARNARTEVEVMAASPAFVVFAVTVALGVFQSTYSTTRYMYFVYPFVLFTIVQSVNDLVASGARLATLNNRSQFMPNLVVVSACCGLFCASRDFNIHHLMNAGSQDVGYRIGAYASFARTWYERWDFESPARFVDRNAWPAERDVIVVLGLGVVQYYLDLDCALYLSRSDSRFAIVSRQQGTKDLWSGERLLSTAGDLLQYTQEAGRVWLVRPIGSRQVDVDSVWDARLKLTEIAYVSRDGRIEVVRIELSPKIG